MVKQSATANELSDGLIRFKVKSIDGRQVRELAVDALVLKLCCEECERAHSYKGGQPNAVFLSDMADRMKAIGVDGCTPSIAYQLWHLAGAAIASLKKNTSETQNSPSGSTRRRKGKGKAEG